jgi:hypothetical protein
MQTSNFSAGGYRFINGVFQSSASVAALPGYALVVDVLFYLLK